MKVKTNKSANKSDKKEVKLDTSSPTKSPATPPSFSIETIKNGFIVSKSWNDDKGHWHNEREFRETNPLEVEVTKK